MFFVNKCVLVFFFSGALSLKIDSRNETAEFLWNLYSFALQSRRIHNQYPYPFSYNIPGKYPEYYQNYPLKTYGQYSEPTRYASYEDPYLYNNLPNYHKPTLPNNDYLSPTMQQSLSNTKESVMEVLYSIAKNDDLHCVPKLICEVTSGTITGRQQSLNLPVNINMESLVSFLSSLNDAGTSPLIYFGKAALLGFTSKGNARSCNNAYPECPADPEKVLKYLNNHNGGFFRFFNGVAPSQNLHQSSRPLPYWNKFIAEQRIQNNVVDYTPSNVKYHINTIFPSEHEGFFTNYKGLQRYRSEKAIVFPNDNSVSNTEFNQDFIPHSFDTLQFPTDENYEQPIRNPKRLPYHDFKFGSGIQKPLPGHKPSPMIFPDRTGTGDLRLDLEELEENTRPISYEYDDVRVVLKPVRDDDNRFHMHIRDGKGFSFPPR